MSWKLVWLSISEENLLFYIQILHIINGMAALWLQHWTC